MNARNALRKAKEAVAAESDALLGQCTAAIDKAVSAGRTYTYVSDTGSDLAHSVVAERLRADGYTVGASPTGICIEWSKA